MNEMNEMNNDGRLIEENRRKEKRENFAFVDS